MAAPKSSLRHCRTTARESPTRTAVWRGRRRLPDDFLLIRRGDVYAYDPSSCDSARCYFAMCDNVATVEAIGTYNAIFGLDEMVAMMLCERHAAIIEDVVVLVTTE
jgi:hypothetical protein